VLLQPFIAKPEAIATEQRILDRVLMSGALFKTANQFLLLHAAV